MSLPRTGLLQGFREGPLPVRSMRPVSLLAHVLRRRKGCANGSQNSPIQSFVRIVPLLQRLCEYAFEQRARRNEDVSLHSPRLPSTIQPVNRLFDVARNGVWFGE